MRSSAALCLVLGACGSNVTGLAVELSELATIRGSVELPPRRGSSTSYRVGVLWAGVPVFVPYCHERGPTPLEPERDVPDPAFFGCTSAYSVVPAVLGPSVSISVPISGEVTFEIPIRGVPPAAVMVGPPGARVAYGSVIVFEDADFDGELDTPRRCGGLGGGGGRGSPTAVDTSTAPRTSEQIYASTFSSLTETQLRIAYVEGTFDAASYFYPHPSCTAVPRAGFSQWTVGSLLDPNGACSVGDIGAPIMLSFGRPEPHNALLCPQGDRQTFPRDPDIELDDLRNGSVQWECTGENNSTLVVVNLRCFCREVRTYPLAGCRDEVNCPIPEWDLRANPPEGWPCPPQYGP